MRNIVITSESSRKSTEISLTTWTTPTGYCFNGYHVWVNGRWVGVYQSYSRAQAEARNCND